MKIFDFCLSLGKQTFIAENRIRTESILGYVLQTKLKFLNDFLMCNAFFLAGIKLPLQICQLSLKIDNDSVRMVIVTGETVLFTSLTCPFQRIRVQIAFSNYSFQ